MTTVHLSTRMRDQERRAEKLAETTAVVLVRRDRKVRFHITHPSGSQTFCGLPSSEWVGAHPKLTGHAKRVCWICVSRANKCWDLGLTEQSIADEVTAVLSKI